MLSLEARKSPKERRRAPYNHFLMKGTSHLTGWHLDNKQFKMDLCLFHVTSLDLLIIECLIEVSNYATESKN